MEPKIQKMGQIEHYFGPGIKGNRTQDLPSELPKINSEQEDIKASDL